MTQPSALHAWPLTSAAAAIAAGKITARALAEAQLARIAATESIIEAWTTLDAGAVLADADRCDAAATRGPLHGIGVGVKDIVATRGFPTGMGSPAFAGHRPGADAACIARLATAGGYVFGKTVTTELGFMHPGKTRNPWNAQHTPGGSSSGSAAAVAAGHVCGAIGAQTNGSIIRPAAYCGVVGFKPTFGAIPFAGTFVFSPSLDTLGTFTRTVTDAVALAGALADPGIVPTAIALLSHPPRLALLRNFPWSNIEQDAADAIDTAVMRLQQHGAQATPVTLPSAAATANVTHRTIMLHEAAKALGQLQARERARLSQVLNAALDAGRAIDEHAYRAALVLRDRAIAELGQWLAPFDAIVSPPAPAGAPASLESTGDPACCTLWSLAGFPAITLPIGRDAAEMPLGMQLAAPAQADARLLAVAAWCEERLPFVGLVLEDRR